MKYAISNEETNTTKRAVLYCRVSTKEQVEDGNSLVTQERLCREYATAEGYEVAEVFIEKGESAKTADRKELNRLLDFCKKNKGSVQAVIAYKIDRISRNLADYSWIKVRLQNYKVIIRSVSEFFEDTPAGRFMENIIANVSQFDNEVRAERSVGGMREAVKEGRYVWKAPLGYDNVRIDNKATIAPNSFAPLVKEVFELIAQKQYSTDVIRLLMHQKGLTDNKGNPITRGYFFRVIRNPLYKGIIKKFGTLSKGTYEPLVSDDLFEFVQAVLSGRANKIRHYQRENPDFPLRRFILSPDGKQLTGYWAKGKRQKYPYYSFHAAGTTIRKDVLETKFVDFLNKLAFTPEHLIQLKTYLEQRFHKAISNKEQANIAIEKRIEEIHTQIDILIGLHAKQSLSQTLFNSRVRKYEAELEQLQELLRVKTEQTADVRGLLKSAKQALLEPGDFWQKSPLNIRRKFQVFVFPQGIVFDGKNCRTPRISSIFNLKEFFDEQKFSKVNLRGNENNNHQANGLLHSKEMIDSKEFCTLIVADLKILDDIVNLENP